MSEDMPPGFRSDDRTAHDRAETDYTGVSFATKEGPPGHWKIMIEEDAPGLPVLRRGDAFLMLHFRDGVDQMTAQEFTTQVRRLIDGLSCTKFIT